MKRKMRYLSQEEKEKSRFLYEQAFPEDAKDFVDYYYSYCTKDNEILVLEQENEICSMVHLNPYTQKLFGQEVKSYYYVAVATREDCRHQGMMKALLERSFRDNWKKKIPYVYLMPVNPKIYEPFDFRIVYEQTRKEFFGNPKEVNETLEKEYELFTQWDEWYVEKRREEQRICGEEAPFDIIPYIMIRISHVEEMLSLIKGEKTGKVFLEIQDEIVKENNGIYDWRFSPEGSSCRKCQKRPAETVPVLTIGALTEAIFGRKQIPGLEEIPVIRKVCIEESV